MDGLMLTLVYLLLVFVVIELWLIGDAMREIKEILKKGIMVRQYKILQKTKTDLPQDWWEVERDRERND